MWNYLKEAFTFHWNLLFFLGATGVAVLSPFPDVLLPIVGAAEMLYLGGMVSAPKFRVAVDARLHKEQRGDRTSEGVTRSRADLSGLLQRLPGEARKRFDALKRGCQEMKRIAQGVGGRTGSGSVVVDDLNTTGLDRLLWVFLRLLYSDWSLGQFLNSTDEKTILGRIGRVRERLEKLEEKGDRCKERKVRSWQDSLATAEMRLDN